MIYAEKRKEVSDEGYYTLRYLVYNGDMIGSYGVQFGPREYDNTGYRMERNPKDPEGDSFAYGASRDYHRLATEADIEARRAHDTFLTLSEDEQEAAYDNFTDPPYASHVNPCEYHDNEPCICDGSSLVEVTLDDKQAFEIAAGMADVSQEGE